MLVPDYMNRKGRYQILRTVDGVKCFTISGARWDNMRNRCRAGGALQRSCPTYVGSRNDFGNINAFVEWSKEQPGYDLGWQLDKDLLVPGNKIYSETTCVFLPRELNIILVKSNKSRGKFPIGVSYNYRASKYIAYCSDGSNRLQHLGYHTDEVAAHSAYKTYKESLIRSLAHKWQSKIDSRAYDALMEYEVKITD